MPVRPSPEAYVSKVEKPVDFDEFWDGVLAQAVGVPLNPETNYSDLRSDDSVAVYETFYDSVDDVRIAGWYCVPRGSEGKLPAMLALPGYQGEPAIPKEWARKGYAALSVAPRGKLRSNSQFNPGYPGLLTHNITDRNTYSYRGFYVDAWRGIDYLLTRDEVDAGRIGVSGGSQGGGLTVTTSAMRSEVTAAIAGAPYLCGYVDAIELTRAYPYEEINDYLRLHPDSRDEVVETLAYFDGTNFADKHHLPFCHLRRAAGPGLPPGDWVRPLRRRRQRGQEALRGRRPRPQRRQAQHRQRARRVLRKAPEGIAE